METKQLNVKLSKELLAAAERYSKQFGYRNVQDLIGESVREKVFENNEFDETFSDNEIEMIDKLITLSIKKGDFVEEEELNKILLR